MSTGTTTPKSDTRLSASKVCMKAPSPPPEVPSLGLDEKTGTRSHGDRASSAAAGCADASGGGCCADADPDHPTVTRSTDSRVMRCLIVPERRQSQCPHSGAVFLKGFEDSQCVFQSRHGQPSMDHGISDSTCEELVGLICLARSDTSARVARQPNRSGQSDEDVGVERKSARARSTRVAVASGRSNILRRAGQGSGWSAPTTRFAGAQDGGLLQPLSQRRRAGHLE